MKYSDVIIGDNLWEFLSSKKLLRKFKENVVKWGFIHRNDVLDRIANSSFNAVNSFQWDRDKEIPWSDINDEFNTLIESNIQIN